MEDMKKENVVEAEEQKKTSAKKTASKKQTQGPDNSASCFYVAVQIAVSLLRNIQVVSCCINNSLLIFEPVICKR